MMMFPCVGNPPVTCCHRHITESAWYNNLNWMLRSFMIVCDICGNKRCPHATNCELECSGSNEPGQPGSRYEMARVE